MAEIEDDEALDYNPNRLIDTLIARMNVKNDASLAREIGVPREVISKVRHGTRPIGSSLLLKMHEASDISIAELRQLMGDRRKLWRVSSEEGKPTSEVTNVR